MLGTVVLFIVVAAIVIFVLLYGMRLAGMSESTMKRAGMITGAVGLVTLAVGLYLGLVWAPTAEVMGDSYRIMYIHFPSWVGTAAGYLTAFVASILYIRTRSHGYDYVAVAGAEIGLLFNVVGLITGALWGRPAWGVYWTWDPRLTTTAIMAITFAGYLVLRAFLEDPEARARVSSLVAIIGFVNVPVQSSPDTIDAPMVLALRVMMIAFVLLFLFMLTQRFMLARLRGEEELEAVRLEVAGD
jgi:heme exporter protein C